MASSCHVFRRLTCFLADPSKENTSDGAAAANRKKDSWPLALAHTLPAPHTTGIGNGS